MAFVGLALTGIESPAPFTGDYEAALVALQSRLERLQLSQIAHGRRAIIVFEGWEGSGKGGALRRLSAAWDACHFVAHSVRGGVFDDGERHWLTPYWAVLPRPGHSAIFHRSWYRRLVDLKATGELDEAKWERALDEANEFEAQQADSGVLVVKLFFDVPAHIQAERLHARCEDQWRRFTLHPDDLRSHSAREGYVAAWRDVFENTDTRWAPWRFIDGSDKRSARIAALSAIAEAFEKTMPAEPPERDDKIVVLAQERYA